MAWSGPPGSRPARSLPAVSMASIPLRSASARENSPRYNLRCLRAGSELGNAESTRNSAEADMGRAYLPLRGCAIGKRDMAGGRKNAHAGQRRVFGLVKPLYTDAAALAFDK